MDLKFKGTTWVGNIYQKFEAMCQEVDDFVSQPKVKYVENQVQTVGDSVKRFCSDVVQDLLPSSLVEPGKSEAAGSPKQNDTIETYIRSVIGIEKKPVFTDINQSSVEQDPNDPLKNSRKQFILLPSADHIKDAESDLSFGPEIDALKDKKSDIIPEESNTKEELRDKKSNTVEEETDTKEPCWLEDLELICPDSKDLSEASLLSESIDEKNGILVEVPPATLVCHTHKDEIACNSFLDENECVSGISGMILPSETDFSVDSCENKTAEFGLISSSSSLSTETYRMSEFSHASVPHDEENICYNPDDAIGRVSNPSDDLSSSQPFPIFSSDNSDMRFAFPSSALPLESNDVNTSTTDDATSLPGASGNRHEYCHECTQLEALMSSLETGEADDCRVDIADPSMETIELSEKAKLDDSCIIVDSKLLYAVSCRAQKHRSYRKLLQDAFTSKKRLRKEYEQLAILYGDIDIESGQQPEQNILPRIPSSLDLKISSSDHNLCDPEWELL